MLEMRTLKKKEVRMSGNLILLLVTFLVPFLTYGQSAMLKGRLVNEETDEPVPFASIGILNTTQGTAADEAGAFTLRITNASSQMRLHISCIGYSSKTLSVDSLLTLNTAKPTIYLTPDARELAEVVVEGKSIRAVEVVQQAIQSVEKNYPQTPFNLELLSIIKTQDTITNKQFKVESVLLGYYEGYNQNGKKAFEIQQVRTTGEDPLESIDYPYWPSFEIVAADLITDPSRRGIFTSTHHDDFSFQYAGLLTYEDDTLYHITYHAPKPTAKATGYGIVPKFYSGDIFITVTNYSIVRHEIRTDAFQYHVIYKKFADRYYPYYFSGTRINEFKLMGRKRPFKTTNTITVTNLVLNDPRVLTEKQNDYDIHKIPYDESFWNSHFPVDGD